MTDPNSETMVDPAEVTMTVPIVPEREVPRHGRRPKPDGSAYAQVLAGTLLPLSSRERGLVLETLAALPGPEVTTGAVSLTLAAVIDLVVKAGHVGAVRTTLAAVGILLDARRGLNPGSVELQHQAVAALLAVERSEASASNGRGRKSAK